MSKSDKGICASRRIIPYNPELKEKADYLRKHVTLAEVLLWKRLNRKQMCGYDFNRQRPIGEHIVDFYCKDLCLAMEIDGRSHDFKPDKDERRQEKLERLGIRFLRFWDQDVKHDMDTVLRQIREWIEEDEKSETST